MNITADDMGNLRHALGATNQKEFKNWGYRNYYAAATCDVPSMERLVESGFMVKGRYCADEHHYHATKEGCQAAGLDKRQTEKALRD